jgi:hypothetical protein
MCTYQYTSQRLHGGLAGFQSAYHREANQWRDGVGYLRFRESKNVSNSFFAARERRHGSTGEDVRELTVKNFAMLNFCSSSAPLTSAIAVILSAGGPVGINIIANHRIGSSSSNLVFVANP